MHLRNQLLRDHAAQLERLRTRKVRRAKVVSEAKNKQDKWRMATTAGRPLFEQAEQ
jgi:hypothetical protein